MILKQTSSAMFSVNSDTVLAQFGRHHLVALCHVEYLYKAVVYSDFTRRGQRTGQEDISVRRSALHLQSHIRLFIGC